MITPYTRKKLTQDFTNLGVQKGDTLFIHASFKSLGPVEDGAGTVISALEAAVGQDGLILMPTFSLLPSREERVAAWDVDKTPSTVGWLTEFFRQMPNTHRSDHYSHAVAARGKGAKAFVSDNLQPRRLPITVGSLPLGQDLRHTLTNVPRLHDERQTPHDRCRL